MKAAEHQGRSLLYLTVEPDDYDANLQYPLIILLHGFGANMRDLASLAPAINREGYVYACPQAALAFQIGPGMMGYGWMPRGAEATTEHIKQAEDALDTFFVEIMEKYHVSPGNVILSGFSQGGGMTYRCGLHQPHLFAGLAVLSGTLPDTESLRARLPEARNQPIFVAHGTVDGVLPIERGRAAHEFLEAEGYQPQYKEYPMAHEISPDVLSDLVQWSSGVLPPLSALSS
jgi:phospholipase/carboxylesterase